MAILGFAGDVSNSIPLNAPFPQGRTYGYVPPAATSFAARNNVSGEISGLNMPYQAVGAAVGGGVAAPATQTASSAPNGAIGKKPAMWWLVFAVILLVISWAARRYAPEGEQFALIKPNLINWLFVTLAVVLTLTLLKQIAVRVRRIPGLTELSDIILSA